MGQMHYLTGEISLAFDNWLVCNVHACVSVVEGKEEDGLYVSKLCCVVDALPPCHHGDIGLGRFWYMTLSVHGGVLLQYMATSVHTMTTSVHNFRPYHFGTFDSTISVHCIRPLRFISNM